jgi:hypothetical protein
MATAVCTDSHDAGQRKVEAAFDCVHVLDGALWPNTGSALPNKWAVRETTSQIMGFQTSNDVATPDQLSLAALWNGTLQHGLPRSVRARSGSRQGSLG